MDCSIIVALIIIRDHHWVVEHNVTVTTEIDIQRKIIIQTVSGEFTSDDLKDDFNSLLSNPDFKTNMNVVWDLRGTRITQYSLDQVRQIPDDLKEFMEKRGQGYRVALVTNRESDSQLLRLYQVPLRMIQAEFKVFSDMEKAYQWTAT